MARTSTTTAYVLQPFWRQGRGFRKGGAQRLASEVQALRSGEELARSCSGVVVMVIEVAEDVDYCGEPRLLASFGEVPEVV